MQKKNKTLQGYKNETLVEISLVSLQHNTGILVSVSVLNRTC